MIRAPSKFHVSWGRNMLQKCHPKWLQAFIESSWKTSKVQLSFSSLFFVKVKFPVNQMTVSFSHRFYFCQISHICLFISRLWNWSAVGNCSCLLSLFSCASSHIRRTWYLFYLTSLKQFGIKLHPSCVNIFLSNPNVILLQAIDF